MKEYFISMAEALRPIIQTEITEALRQFKVEATSTTDPRNKYYTRKEACKLLNISLVTLTKLVYDGQLEAKRLGRRVLFTPEAIDNALRTMRVK